MTRQGLSSDKTKNAWKHATAAAAAATAHLSNLILAPHHLLELDLADVVSGAGAAAREGSRPRGGGQALGAGPPLLAPPPPTRTVGLAAALIVAQGRHTVHVHWVQLAFHLRHCLLSGHIRCLQLAFCMQHSPLSLKTCWAQLAFH